MRLYRFIADGKVSYLIWHWWYSILSVDETLILDAVPILSLHLSHQFRITAFQIGFLEKKIGLAFHFGFFKKKIIKLDCTNFVTAPVKSIQNYSFPKLAAIHAIQSNKLEMAEIGSAEMCSNRNHVRSNNLYGIVSVVPFLHHVVKLLCAT